MKTTIRRAPLVPTIVCLAVAGCSDSPLAPSPLPVAVISIEGGVGTPPLGIFGYTPLVFSASRSTGDGLRYAWTFGDLTTSTQVAPVHVSSTQGQHTATLTVTDARGRQATTSAAYAAADIEPGVGWWQASFTSRTWISLGPLKRNGSTLSGIYAEVVSNQLAARRPFIGTLTGPHTITIRTTDGLVELVGVMDWVDGPSNAPNTRAGLRLTARGGFADGLVLNFKYDDPY